MNTRVGYVRLPNDDEPGRRPDTDVWQRQNVRGGERLLIQPEKDPLGLLRDLAATWWGGFFLLYVLIEPRAEHLVGRYESPGPLTLEQVRAFCEEFEAFLVSDGRHHLWIGSTENIGTVVYDHHDVVYAYGDIERYIGALERRGFREGYVDALDVPHLHCYLPDNDAIEERILDFWEWRRFDLEACDDQRRDGPQVRARWQAS